MSRRATALLASREELVLTDVVVAEFVHVLASFYKQDRSAIATAVRALVSFDSIVTIDAGLIIRAVEIYETARIDFAEAYLVACAEVTGVRRVASFDKSIDRVTTIERVEPGRP
ncbi:MAG: hypothetical protein QOF21_2555 [Actinomycetota bacterium]|jgi:predicted nucleic-acid-binding protein